MRTLLDILKKDRKGTFEWLETVNDIKTAKARVLQLSSESMEEFVVFRGPDLQVVVSSQTADGNVLISLKDTQSDSPFPPRSRQ